MRAEVIKSTKWLGALTILKSISQVAFLIILARLLSPTDFGVVASMFIIINILVLISESGIGQALIQKKSLTKNDIITAKTLTISVSILIYILYVISLSSINSFFKIEDYYFEGVLLGSIIIINSIPLVRISLEMREVKFKAITLITTFSYLLGSGLITIVLAFAQYGVKALVLGVIAQYIIQAVLVFSFISSRQTSSKLSWGIDMRSAKDLLYYGYGHTLAKFGTGVAQQLDKIVINRVLGIEALGLYSRAYQLINVPSIALGGVLEKIMFSSLSRKQEDVKLLLEVLMSFTLFTVILFVPISGIVYLLSDLFIDILFGEAWMELSGIVALLALAIPFRVSYKVCDAVIKSRGMVYWRAASQMLYAILIGVGAIIGSLYGIIGLAGVVARVILINFSVLFMIATKSLSSALLTSCKIYSKVVFVYVVTISPYVSLTLLKIDVKLTYVLISALISLFVIAILLLTCLEKEFIFIKKVLFGSRNEKRS